MSLSNLCRALRIRQQVLVRSWTVRLGFRLGMFASHLLVRDLWKVAELRDRTAAALLQFFPFLKSAVAAAMSPLGVMTKSNTNNVDTYISIFEWYVDLRTGITMASCVSKEIGLRAQNMPTILVAIHQHD